MLQRAASNAYSWWWASHIRTKQSKWVEQNLQDMEEKVQGVLKLLAEEGDSFAKRAEMYYKRRPELINFVEESFRAYRSLADRYDHISTELQNANNTIAQVCPDQVPYMDHDEEDDDSPRPPRKVPKGSSANIPNVPKPPHKDLKTVITTATKKLNQKKAATPAPAPKSGLTKKKARLEVDKLQKEILALQTVKEFVKSSYDNAISRYQESEQQIKQLQERVSNLQNEIGEGVAIDDDEARQLMEETALKSCQEALSKLEEKQAISLDETRIESTRIKEVQAKLRSLMEEFKYDSTNSKRDVKKLTRKKDLSEDVDKITQQRRDLQILQEKIKQHYGEGSSSGLTVLEMAEKIDELVNKVISLETAVSSQTAHVKRLKIETNELDSMVQALESDKGSLTKDKLTQKLREMDEKVHEIQGLNEVVDDQNSNLETHFTEARCSLGDLSEIVHEVKPDEEAEVREIPPTERNSSRKVESEHDLKGQGALDTVNADNELKVAGSLENKTKVSASPKMEEGTPVENESTKSLKETEKNQDTGVGNIVSMIFGLSKKKKSTAGNEESSGKSNKSSEDISVKNQENDSKEIQSETKTTPKGDTLAGESNMRQLSTDGIKDKEKEKDLLAEYTNMLQSYENVKNKLIEVEKKNEDTLFESSLQLKELKTANALKDEEIQLLREKLGLLQKTLEENENRDIEEVQKIEEPKPTSAIEDKLLQDYENMKNKLIEVEKKNQDTLSESSLQLKELKTANALKDEEIQLLREKLGLLQKTLEENENRDIEEVQKIEEPKPRSAIEDKLLQDYENIKNKLIEVEKKNQDTLSESSLQLKELKTSNDLKDEEIQLLREKLGLLQKTMEENENRDIEEVQKIEEPEPTSAIEDKLLQDYENMKNKLMEVEKKNQDTLFESSLQLKELKTANALKDEEIRLLRQKLSLLQENMGEVASVQPPENYEIEEVLKLVECEPTSAIEEKFRSGIDELLEENLEFWLRFSTSFTQVQKFEASIKDLLSEVKRIEEKWKASEGSSSTKYSLKSDARPLHKHMAEIQTELTMWLESSVMLKEDLQSRFTSLCEIQEEITAALNASAEGDDFKFTSHQAAKFQGEVLNMKQENNRVADELQSGLDLVTTLQLSVEKALANLNEQFGLSNAKRNQRANECKDGIPLRSFIFGVKPKKQKQSIFSCMTPGMNKKYRGYRG